VLCYGAVKIVAFIIIIIIIIIIINECEKSRQFRAHAHTRYQPTDTLRQLTSYMDVQSMGACRMIYM